MIAGAIRLEPDVVVVVVVVIVVGDVVEQTMTEGAILRIGASLAPSARAPKGMAEREGEVQNPVRRPIVAKDLNSKIHAGAAQGLRRGIQAAHLPALPFPDS